MNTPDHTPTYLAICQSVRADAFILGIEPSDESEHARDKAKVEHFDKDNAAVSRLVVRGLLTHAEAQKAYSRLVKKVTDHLHTHN